MQGRSLSAHPPAVVSCPLQAALAAEPLLLVLCGVELLLLLLPEGDADGFKIETPASAMRLLRRQAPQLRPACGCCDSDEGGCNSAGGGAAARLLVPLLLPPSGTGRSTAGRRPALP